ncbi:MAG TPA: ABC transporter substrate-binding protein [Solirubrobacteraceae bacterium]|jgi:peptide/nickel transport system substrate-binding protein|nr:ABC transporter substrate-binding protein [Solirubrobacteraceae bacterium]
MAAALVLAACGGSGSGAGTGAGSGAGTGTAVGHVIATTDTPVQGGTAYWAEQPLSPPNYIFPLISGAYYSNENVYDFQTLMYRPLYWYGDRGTPAVDYALSLGDPPVYSDRDRVVTITLKHAKWSDGEPVSARDVIFWINLLKANKAEWASYVPGGFPDNVISWTAVGARTVRLRLNRSYNPIWFTDNELSQITPLPMAWDSVCAPGDLCIEMPAAPDTKPAWARKIYAFLNQQAKKLSSYASSPIWSIVDGPWKLQSLTSSGQAAFVPNGRYDGPDKPKLAKFVELPFTSETAEFSVLRAGTAKGDGGGSSPQISAGYVPDTDVPQAPALRSQGYRLSAFYPYGFDYFEPNFNNPTVGPILRQLYFRQAFQHLVDQTGWIHAYYEGLGAPTYSPVPAQPANPYADVKAHTNPYPFSVTAAKRLLEAHGWKVAPNATTSCVRAGSGTGDCGAGIAAGQRLRFTLMYPSAMSSTDGAMVDLQSVARQVGITITLKQVTTATIDAEIEPCKPHTAACAWQLGQYGAAWVFAPDHYPTGEEIFQSGALGNVGSYSDRAIDRLIKATTTSPAGGAQRALDAYADAVRTQLPDFWQPSPGTLETFQSNLAGATANAYGYLSPEEWYFTR